MELSVSVVIPTFQRPEALRRTVQALLRQAGDTPFEIVICDDGSPPDDAAQIQALTDDVRAWTPRGVPRTALRVLRQENAGPAAARNAGARVAAAPLLLFLDDDCTPAPGLVACHLQQHSLAPHVAVLGHVSWTPSVPVTPFMELIMRGAQFNYGAITDPEQVPFTLFYTANCSLHRADLEAAGWFDASMPPFMEDTEFAYRLTRSGTRIIYRSEALVFHEHAVELASYLDRQRKAGRAAVHVVRRHPELFDVVGVGDVADLSLREQYYSTLLRYAFIIGVEEGLTEQETLRAITGFELRSEFERWIAQWAVHEASRTRAWRVHAEALHAEVARRDSRLAAITQQKDAQIASVEAQLARFNRLPPVRLYQAFKRWRAFMRHNPLRGRGGGRNRDGGGRGTSAAAGEIAEGEGAETKARRGYDGRYLGRRNRDDGRSSRAHRSRADPAGER